MNKVLGVYDLKDVKESSYLVLSPSLNERELHNLKYIKNDYTISLVHPSVVEAEREISEEEYISQVRSIFKRFRELKTNVTLHIETLSRKKLKDSNLLNEIPDNVELFIFDDGYCYPIDEYLEEESKLYDLLKDIIDKDMTPFEKYLAVYNIVTHFKEYKKDDDVNVDTSRRIRYVLNGEAIVCTGFARLLKNLLDKVGIQSIVYDFNIDKSYDEGFTLEDTPVKKGGHSRLLVHLEDSEYGINGYYVSDPTWDNNMKNDYYNYAALPFNKTETERRFSFFHEYDCFLNVTSMEEYNKRINYYLDTYGDEGYYLLFISATNMLKILDEEEYVKLYNKFGNGYKLSVEKYQEFLTDFGNFIITRNNIEIDPNTMVKGIVYSKKESSSIKLSELKSWSEKVFDDYSEREARLFPFTEEVNENITRGI